MAGDSYAEWRERLSRSNSPEFWPIEAIDKELEAGRAGFFGTEKAALVVRVVTYPGGAKVLEALAGAGVKDGLTDEIEQLAESWARSNGMDWLSAPGRFGWLRVLKAKGWEMHNVIMRKDLRNG